MLRAQPTMGTKETIFAAREAEKIQPCGQAGSPKPFVLFRNDRRE
jgi:hypothetical protein